MRRAIPLGIVPPLSFADWPGGLPLEKLRSEGGLGDPYPDMVRGPTIKAWPPLSCPTSTRCKKNTIDPIPFAGDPTAIFLPFLHSLLWINQGLKMIPKKIIAAPD